MVEHSDQMCTRLCHSESNISFISMVMVNTSESPDDILYAAHSVV